jgi:hypothetical protein
LLKKKKQGLGHLEIGHRNLFGAWDLVIGISVILGLVLGTVENLPREHKCNYG